MDESERRKRGNTRGAIVLLVLGALAALAAWRNRPNPTIEEAPREIGEVMHGDETLGDEMLGAAGGRSRRSDIRITVLNGPDAGR